MSDKPQTVGATPQQVTWVVSHLGVTPSGTPPTMLQPGTVSTTSTPPQTPPRTPVMPPVSTPSSGGQPPPQPPPQPSPQSQPPVQDPRALQAKAEEYVRERWADVKIELEANLNGLNARLPEKDRVAAAFDVPGPTVTKIAGEQLVAAKLPPTAGPDAVKPALTRLRDDVDKALKTAAGGPLKTVENKLKEIKPDTATCKERMRTQKYSWKAVKAAYLNQPQVMWEMIQFRKETVDGLLKALNQKNGDKLVAKSVGGTNLTSDYDITLSTKDGTGEEIDAIKEFNATIKAQLTVPPGRLLRYEPLRQGLPQGG